MTTLLKLHGDAIVEIIPVPDDIHLILVVTQRGLLYIYDAQFDHYYKMGDLTDSVSDMATDWREDYEAETVDVDPYKSEPDPDDSMDEMFGSSINARAGYQRGLNDDYDERGILSAAFDPRDGDHPRALFITRTMDMAEYAGTGYYRPDTTYDPRYDHYLVVESYPLKYGPVRTRGGERSQEPPLLIEDMMSIDVDEDPLQWMAIPHASRIHNGMRILFDPVPTALDATKAVLFVAVGDEGIRRGDPILSNMKAQDYRKLHGKILRIDVSVFMNDMRDPDNPRNMEPNPPLDGYLYHYQIPEDNPYAKELDLDHMRRQHRRLGREAKTIQERKRVAELWEYMYSIRPEIWAAGIRNVSGMDIHPLTYEQIIARRKGKRSTSPSTKPGSPLETILVVGHVGHHDQEGVFVLLGGENLGWPYRENGMHQSYKLWKSDIKKLTNGRVKTLNPALAYSHTKLDKFGSAIIGGVVFDRDGYICGDFGRGDALESSSKKKKPHKGQLMITRLTEYDFRNNLSVGQSNVTTIHLDDYVKCIGRNWDGTEVYVGIAELPGPLGFTSLVRVEDVTNLAALTCEE